MATVFIPPQMRDLTDGAASIVVAGGTLRDVLAELDQAHAGLAKRIAPDGALAMGLAVAINGSITNRGLLSVVPPDSEIHILPAIGGG